MNALLSTQGFVETVLICITSFVDLLIKLLKCFYSVEFYLLKYVDLCFLIGFRLSVV